MPSDFPPSQQNSQSGISPATESSPNVPYQGKIYETFSNPRPVAPQSPISAPENANAIPGGATNTAGGRVREATILDGLKSIQLHELRQVHTKPCVRDAFLVGIAGGFAVGGVRLILAATMWRSMSYAIGTFCLSSAGMYEFCQRRRALERKGMERATEIIERKKIEKERMRELVRAERRRRREKEEQQREEDEEEKKKRSKRKSSWWA